MTHAQTAENAPRPFLRPIKPGTTRHRVLEFFASNPEDSLDYQAVVIKYGINLKRARELLLDMERRGEIVGKFTRVRPGVREKVYTAAKVTQ